MKYHQKPRTHKPRTFDELYVARVYDEFAIVYELNRQHHMQSLKSERKSPRKK